MQLDLKNAKVLPRSFFDRSSFDVAHELLGKVLCCGKGKDAQRVIINEVEVYDGFDDKASHAHRKKTPRNSVMFGGAGNWYVYLCYGVHDLLNIVTREEEYPAAILIRGALEVSGPGRLTKYLGVDRAFDRRECAPKAGLWIEDHGISVPVACIERTPRIGVDYAGDVWAKKPYRYVFKNVRKN